MLESDEEQLWRSRSQSARKMVRCACVASHLLPTAAQSIRTGGGTCMAAQLRRQWHAVPQRRGNRDASCEDASARMRFRMTRRGRSGASVQTGVHPRGRSICLTCTCRMMCGLSERRQPTPPHRHRHGHGHDAATSANAPTCMNAPTGDCRRSGRTGGRIGGQLSSARFSVLLPSDPWSCARRWDFDSFGAALEAEVACMYVHSTPCTIPAASIRRHMQHLCSSIYSAMPQSPTFTGSAVGDLRGRARCQPPPSPLLAYSR